MTRASDGLGGCPIPDGIPGALWEAVRALRAEIERIDGEAMNDAQVNQETSAGEYTWCSEAARALLDGGLAFLFNQGGHDRTVCGPLNDGRE